MAMTVATQIKSCLASLKSAQADLEQFALNTQNQEAKNVFTKAASAAKEIIADLEGRISQIEMEEPQYKGF